MLVRISIGQLRRAIRQQIIESNTWANYSRNAMSPETDDREAIKTMQLKTVDGENELSAHLQDAGKVESDEDVWGPVPPKKTDLAFAAINDPFTNDWNVTGRNR